MNTKKIIMPLFLATQICYGAADGDSSLQSTLTNTQKALTRIAELLAAHPGQSHKFAKQVSPAVCTLNAAIVKAERDLKDAVDKPRTVFPQPQGIPSRQKSSLSDLPGLAGGSDHEDN